MTIIYISFLLLSLLSLLSSAPCSKQIATMYLGPQGRTLYTSYMQGTHTTPIASTIDVNSPIVGSIARFPDGTWVHGGVLKSGKAEYNIIFMWVFHKNGTQYADWPIDVSDFEDFESTEYQFQLGKCDYVLKVVDEVEKTSFLQ